MRTAQSLVSRSRHSFYIVLGSSPSIVHRPQFAPSRDMSCNTFDDQHTFTWHLHSNVPTTRPASTSSNFLSSETTPCAVLQQVSTGYLADPTTFTGHEPKDLAENEVPRVNPLFTHRPRKASTCDSAESIATLPPESDVADEQIRALLASPLYLQEREASADRSQFFHFVRENLMSSSSQDP